MARGQPPVTAFVAVVQRGRVGVYETLKAEFEGEDATRPVQVVWDRRRADRRRQAHPATVERRQLDRRGRPLHTWMTLGFVLVPAR